MSFRLNDYEQFSIFDTMYSLTPMEKKALENSWVKMFAEDVYPTMMNETSIRNLSRMELINKCIAKTVSWLHKNRHDDIIGGIEQYYDPNDFNAVIYHARSTDTDDRLEAFPLQYYHHVPFSSKNVL